MSAYTKSKHTPTKCSWSKTKNMPNGLNSPLARTTRSRKKNENENEYIPSDASVPVTNADKDEDASVQVTRTLTKCSSKETKNIPNG